jgi:hypothetical protein
MNLLTLGMDLSWKVSRSGWTYPARWGSRAGDRGAAAKRVIAKRRLPVPSDDELGTIQELGAVKECSSEIGTVQQSFEEVRPLQVGSRQIRIAAFRSPKIGAPKVRPRKIEPAQIVPSQGGAR